MQEMATSHRAFRIKNCDFELAGIPISDTKSNVSCIICIMNNENNDLDDSERQMYRFDTHGVSAIGHPLCFEVTGLTYSYILTVDVNRLRSIRSIMSAVGEFLTLNT